ncbi:MAG: bifunctional 4-hydroxy-2-oxoglutarate aldolase/2-dehydro-3-deoxy-phosphogluconate aldolase [Clostridiaceae bacterium]|nr:bifunctional 4-hydroxy-2-oxoglutarate aldolase/2-dehydro-3-deoxy-phosphogluconate aldolase [Clostridiaceae bacterium]
MDALLESLYQSKLIAILRGVPNDRAVDTVRALCAGGIRFAEITFDQRNPPCAAMAIHMLARQELVCVGAGTVMTPGQVDMAADAGARYIISPNVDAAVIERTHKRGLLSIPGAFTPSEVAEAYKYGADVVKLFPADSLGTAYVRALLGPYAHIPLAAVGGIDARNVRAFLDAGCVCAGVGGSLVDRKAIFSGRYDVLTEKAHALCAAAGV